MATAYFDYDSIRERLISRLRAKESWKNILFNSTNARLIDVFAEELAYDMQYDEMLTTEAKWNLAQQMSSIMSETDFFNYYPYRKIGSFGNIRVSSSPTFNSTYGTTIAIPKWSVFSTDTGIDFVCSESTSLSIYDNYVEVPVSQGTPKSATFTAVGAEYETFQINNSSVENSIMDVYVNGLKWTQVDYIREAENSYSQVYVVKTLKDLSGVTVSFGNDYFGQKLKEGDIVLVQYLETLGSEGNIDSSNVITTVTSTIYDINDNVVTVYCTNNSAISGGKDYEDIESIRAKAPRAYSTGDRAINKDDYKSIIENFSYVEKATVWGETEINEDEENIPGTYISTAENMVYVSAVTTSGGILTDDEKNDILTVLNSKKPPTDIISFQNPVFTYLVFNTNASVTDTSYALSTVKTNIISTLATNYSLANVEFKNSIRYSNYMTLIGNIAGVAYHTTTISFYKIINFSSAYVADINLYMSDIKAGSVKIYIRDTSISDSSYIQIAHDDGSGNFIAETGYTISASTINYDTGIGSITVTLGLSSSFSYYTIKIIYDVLTSDALSTVRNQIISYGKANVNVEYKN